MSLRTPVDVTAPAALPAGAAPPRRPGLPATTTLVPPTVPVTEPNEIALADDVVQLKTLQSVELFVAGVYGAYGPKLTDSALRAAAFTFQTDHAEIADVFGDESRRRRGSVQSAEEYVGKWSPEHDGGFIAYDDELVPAGGVWLRYWKPGEDYSEANLGPDIPELAIAVENRSHGHRLGRILLQAACDLAAEHPDKVEELKALWLEEAKANDVLPLNDLQIIGNPKDFETFVAMEFHQPAPPSGQFVYYPGTSEVPERSAANVHNVSYKVLAEVDLTPSTEGIIFAHGSRFGGHALFIKDGTITYVDSTRIVIDDTHTYKLRKYVGLNERTCLNQKPVIAVGQKVKKGEILADGAATYKGELALGRNLTPEEQKTRLAIAIIGIGRGMVAPPLSSMLTMRRTCMPSVFAYISARCCALPSAARRASS